MRPPALERKIGPSRIGRGLQVTPQPWRKRSGRNGSYMPNAACRNADVLLRLGTRFDHRASSAWLPGFTYNIPPSKLIHVDIDATEIGRNFQPEIGIISDAKLFLQQLLSAQRGSVDSGRDAWLERIAGW